MNARAVFHYTEAEAISLFDEAMGNRQESQAIAIIRAAQSGNGALLIALVRTLIDKAEMLDSDDIDAKRDDANERCDALYDAWKDSLPSMLKEQA